jgi:carboxypeptidase T
MLNPHRPAPLGLALVLIFLCAAYPAIAQEPPPELLTPREQAARDRIGPPAPAGSDEDSYSFPTRGVSGILGFPCYPTVEETLTLGQSLATTKPNLAEWVDAGDSWLKTQAAGGFDLQVLVLTNESIPGPKPKLFIMSGLHPREYAPVGIAVRFAMQLVNNYGVQADETWLLDYHEIHFLFQANPDGRKQAETGLFWRKNANNLFCTDTNSRGVDLNRNFPFMWSCCGGASGFECDLTYRGPGAGSEPETSTVINYLRSIFPDQRGPGVNDAAPANATGVFIDLHSFGQQVLWPYGFDATPTPNGTAMQTLGRKLAYPNGYSPEKASQSFNSDGASDDFAYGDLGVAAYTFEVGTTFFEACSFFENTLVPTLLPALMTAAKSARTPYLTPSGPDVLAPTVGLTADPNAIVVSGTSDDGLFENSNGTEPVQNVAAAECYVDVPPWEVGATAIALSASDGAFDASREDFVGTVSVGALPPGQHILFVRAQDSSGNWGNVSAVFYTKSAGGIPAMSWQGLTMLILSIVALGGMLVRWKTART